MAVNGFPCLWKSRVPGRPWLGLPVLVDLLIWGPRRCGGPSDTRGCPDVGREADGAGGHCGPGRAASQRPHGRAGGRGGDTEQEGS